MMMEWLYLQKPTFVGSGQTYWIDNESGELRVDRGGERVTRHGLVTDRTARRRR